VVWVGYPDAGIALPCAQGGTYAAPVWHAFMLPAHGEECDDFPEPETPAEFHPFFGKYSSTGKPVVPLYGEDDGTTTDDSGGTGTDQQFDPRYYEEAPQNAPDVQVPPDQGTPDQGAPPDQQGADPGAQ
jgi:hypothetical protein